MDVGNRIKMRRKELGLSQEELARKLGYKSRSTVNKIEKGVNEITQSKILAFAKALDTSVNYLMGDDVEENHTNFADLMTQKKVSMNEISHDLGIPIQTLKHLDKGSVVPIETLRKVAMYFNVSVDSLLNIPIVQQENESSITASMRALGLQKRWHEEIGDVILSDDEMDDLIDFVKFMLSKRKKD